jgi:hypothetical protein
LEPSTSKGGDGATPVRSKKKSATVTVPPGAPSSPTNRVDANFSPRELRQRRREQLRGKATGMISVTSPAKNKKVIFDEDSTGADAVVAQPMSEDEPRNAPAADAVVEDPSSPTDKARRKVVDGHNDDDEEDDDEDDDDGVEEMTSKAARQEDLERRELERRTARAASQTAAKKSRKRRESKAEQQAEPKLRKNSDASSDGPEGATAMFEGGTDMDMDESFFAQLDEARETERKERRRRRLDDTAGMQRGKHTTFVVEGESAEAAFLHRRPIAKKVDHNVHVVVLPAAPAKDDDFPALPPPIFTSEPVSSTALVCSRGLLLDGSDVMSAKAQQKAKKNGVAHLVKDNAVPGWTRSKKMSFLASSKSRRKKGTAAPIFAVKK